MNKLFSRLMILKTVFTPNNNEILKNKTICLLKQNEISCLLQKNSYCSKYYSKKKTIKPSVIAVSKGNQHLKVKLFDEKDVEIGVVDMKKAQEIANQREFKLVLVDEEMSPPKFRLMKGSELFSEQIKIRNEKKTHKSTSNESRDKEFQLNLKTADHDLSYKIKSIQEHYDKGHAIKILIKTSKTDENIDVLQTEMINRIKSKLNVKSFEIKKRNESFVLILIASKQEKDEVS